MPQHTDSALCALHRRCRKELRLLSVEMWRRAGSPHCRDSAEVLQEPGAKPIPALQRRNLSPVRDVRMRPRDSSGLKAPNVLTEL